MRIESLRGDSRTRAESLEIPRFALPMRKGEPRVNAAPQRLSHGARPNRREGPAAAPCRRVEPARVSRGPRATPPPDGRRAVTLNPMPRTEQFEAPRPVARPRKGSCSRRPEGLCKRRLGPPDCSPRHFMEGLSPVARAAIHHYSGLISRFSAASSRAHRLNSRAIQRALS